MTTRYSRAAIGVSAHLGWAATATIAVGRRGIRVLRTDRLEIAAPEDRGTREPFHVAGGFEGLGRVPQPANPEQSLRKGLEKQRRAARRAVSGLAAELEDAGSRIAFAGVMVSRGRVAPDFERSIGSHTQIHIEEGIAIRASIADALEACGAKVSSLDQKTIWSAGSEQLGLADEALRAALRAAKPENGGSWRKEEQTAALAAWLAWPRRTA